jgi:myo-inositol 2-dehydrogenase/D-chiro-inositol 1-dehydrogenase
MTNRTELGIAVIGTGKMGADHVRRINEIISGARVTAVVDIDEARTKELADGIPGCTPYTDHRLAMDDPAVDAVLLASPGPAHEAQLLDALERDLPVLCEKPLTPDSESALRVLEAEQRLGHRRIQVGFMRRYDKEYMQLKELLGGGSMGRPLLLHCRHRNASVHDYFTNEMLITDAVVHEMDCARWLLEHEISAITVVRPTPSVNAPRDLSDPQLVLFETDGGSVVNIEMFATCGFGYQVQVEAVCENGTARIGEGHALMTNTAGRWGGEITPDFVARFEEAYDREVQQWADAARRGEAEGPSAWDGYAAAAVAEAGVKAQGSGERTPVSMIQRPALYA